jgi:hypothetical protein
MTRVGPAWRGEMVNIMVNTMADTTNGEGNPKSAPNRQRGATILETMVTMSITAILLMLSVPGMVDFVRSHRSTTGAAKRSNGGRR